MKISSLLTALLASLITLTAVTSHADQLADIKKKARSYLARWALTSPTVR